MLRLPESTAERRLYAPYSCPLAKSCVLDVTGNATISANIHGTEVALGDYHTTEQTVTATGNLFDGSGSDNHVDNVISVGTTLTVQGSGASITVAQNDSAPHTVEAATAL